MASKQPTPTQNQTTNPNIDDIASKITTMMFCLYNAHFMNAVNPGCFQEQLDHLTSANNLPRMVGPQNPPSADILNIILNNNLVRHQQNNTATGNLPLTTQDNTQTHQKAQEQPNSNLSPADSTTENSSDSEPEEQVTEEHIENNRMECTHPTIAIQKNKTRKKNKIGTLPKTMIQTTKHKNNFQANKTHLQQTLPTPNQETTEQRDPRLRLRTQ